ncbi:MAG: exodeoxyribonuclease VII large subunit [Oscillospiraceae bacterium]|nr:exodeoxyribonuclease VII large subunit [Oscillospiraceae bacterium]
MIDVKKPSFITVSQLNYYVKSLLDGDMNLRYVFVSGEISNLTDHYSSGHIYLSLKDEKSTVKAVMFSYSAKNLKFRPQNGMKVIVRGKVTLYEATGQYQLYIEDMQPDGVGALALAFEQLKEKLEKEGLFDKRHKKPLPQFPKIISVITSPTGAALQDIKNIISRRWPYVQVRVFPVLVQGESAPRMLTEAVKAVDAEGESDVIIIGRGGGSMEDLWAFNSEELARAIFKCNIPVVSAVGHEVDFTISDFVSDMRAPTPSAAAELVTPDRFEQLDLLRKQRQYLAALGEKLLSEQQMRLEKYEKILKDTDPRVKYDNQFEELKALAHRLVLISDRRMTESEQMLSQLKHRLFSLSPSEILKRGYTVTSKEGKTVYSKAELKSGDRVSIKFKDGDIDAAVI